MLSHHNSLTLENTAHNVFDPGETLIHGEEFVDMLLQYPNLVAWLNGHTHINTIQAHPKKGGVGGFWEITTASCIDYPQQAQVVELGGQQGRHDVDLLRRPGPRLAGRPGTLATSHRWVWRR